MPATTCVGDLPQETLTAILRFVAPVYTNGIASDDGARATLKSCEGVCKYWHQACRPILWETVTVAFTIDGDTEYANQHDGLLNTFDEARVYFEAEAGRDLGKHVQSLTLRCRSSGNYELQPSDLLSLLASFPNVVDLLLEDVFLDLEDWEEEDLEALPHPLPKLRCLWIGSNARLRKRFEIDPPTILSPLILFEYVDTIRITNNDQNVWLPISEPLPCLRCTATTLSVRHYGYDPAVVRRLVDTAIFTSGRLRVLDLAHLDPEEIGSCERLVEAAGKTLERLALHFYDTASYDDCECSIRVVHLCRD